MILGHLLYQLHTFASIFIQSFFLFLTLTFEYIGLWVLLCLILQAWFSWKLAGLITQDLLLRLLIRR